MKRGVFPRGVPAFSSGRNMRTPAGHAARRGSRRADANGNRPGSRVFGYWVDQNNPGKTL
jgi:hypothetical protein